MAAIEFYAWTRCEGKSREQDPGGFNQPNGFFRLRNLRVPVRSHELGLYMIRGFGKTRSEEPESHPIAGLSSLKLFDPAYKASRDSLRT